MNPGGWETYTSFVSMPFRTSNIQQVVMGSHNKQHTHRVQASHRREDFVEVNAGALRVALRHQTCLVSYYFAGGVLLHLVDPFQSNGPMAVRQVTQFPRATGDALTILQFC
jgi:hypothetical protein